MNGKGRSDRGERNRKLEEDLASKEGVNEVRARRADKPYREEITTEKTDHLESAVLGDSIVNEIFTKNAKVVTCPGAQIHQLTERKILDDFSRLGIQKIAILGGTNNMARRDGSIQQPEEFSDQMKDLVEMYKNEGFQVVIMEVPWRRHREEEIKKINRQYEKIAKKAKCEFHRYRRFSKAHIDKKDGVHPATDGPHPNPGQGTLSGSAEAVH